MQTRFYLRSIVMALAGLLLLPHLSTAEPVTPAAGSQDRTTLLDTLRTDDAVMKHAASSGKPIVFKVHALLVEDRVAIAEVTPMTSDEKQTFPSLLALVRRGGDEPWALVASGSAKDSGKWVTTVLADEVNGDFKSLWAFYQKTSSKSASSPGPFLSDDHLERIAVLKAVRDLPLIVDMGKDLGKEIILTESTVAKSGDWAWVTTEPRTADRSWQGESLSLLMQKNGKKWQVVTDIPDAVLSADDPDNAYDQWRTGLLKQHPTLSPDLIPKD